MTTVPARDAVTAQTLATRIVADGLGQMHGQPIEHGGEWFRLTSTRLHRRPGSIDGLVSFTVDADDGPVLAVTVQISATPLGGA